MFSLVIRYGQFHLNQPETKRILLDKTLPEYIRVHKVKQIFNAEETQI
jgi:hypothetical protein